ncbi:hypothetical protein EDM60_20840 [Brevibacillus parabrevis]|nr:hypothetical protein EDM60_20840 [Brevibacillus parabrevis]
MTTSYEAGQQKNRLQSRGGFFCKQVFSEALHGVFFSGMFLILISLAASLLLGKARLIEKKNPVA